MTRPLRLLVVLAIVWVAFPAAASDLEDRLAGHLKGAWATIDVEVYSNCSGTYSDNKMGLAGVASKADRRFEPGELAKIDKVKVKRSRVDLLTTLAVPVLAPHMDGPFELYDVLECRAQLIFEIPRSVIKSSDTDAVLETIGRALTTHPDQDSAMDSSLWNSRRRQPFPDDYDLTLARHQRWSAEQTNAAVATGIDRASEKAADIADDIDRDPDYLDGFAAGAEEMRHIHLDDCADLIDASFYSWDENPPSDMNATWKRGFDDGQRLVFHLIVLRELRHCYVPVPDAPAP